jgi:hypothetical protein
LGCAPVWLRWGAKGAYHVLERRGDHLVRRFQVDLDDLTINDNVIRFN